MRDFIGLTADISSVQAKNCTIWVSLADIVAFGNRRGGGFVRLVVSGVDITYETRERGDEIEALIRLLLLGGSRE
jgi:hypothetical protein